MGCDGDGVVGVRFIAGRKETLSISVNSRSAIWEKLLTTARFPTNKKSRYMYQGGLGAGAGGREKN